MSKKLLCLNVEELKCPDKSASYFSNYLPKLCSVFITQTLFDNVNRAMSILSENDLLEIVLSVDYINWFIAVDKQIFQTVNSQLHVRSSHLYFSGAFAPQREPSFQTTWIPVNSIKTESKALSKIINNALLTSPVAKAAIAEIKYLDNEREVATNRQDSLEVLNNVMNSLPPASLFSNGRNSDDALQALFLESKQLEKHIDKLEDKINQCCLALCKSVLDIGIGDRLFTQTNYKNQNREIVVEAVTYYDGTIFVEGPKALQNNTLGKRNETVSIEIVTKHERC